MNKLKTSELTGAALDWAVAKCEGVQFGPTLEGRYMYWSPDDVIEFARAIERAHGAIERAHGIGEHE